MNNVEKWSEQFYIKKFLLTFLIPSCPRSDLGKNLVDNNVSYRMNQMKQYIELAWLLKP